MTKTFSPGEWAVYPSDVGGRLFQVGHVKDHRAFEAQSEWGIQYRQPADSLGTHIDNLVKVNDRDTGLLLIGALKHAYATHRSKLYNLEVERDASYRKAIGEYEAYEPEPDQ
jgi:hypothetical protein